MDFEYQKNEKFRELCYIGDLQLIKSFCKSNNPDVNSKNKVNGWTSLHWACSKSNLNLIKYLLESGGDLNSKNNDGKTPIDYIKDTSIRNMFGLSSLNEDEKETKTIVPNFVKNPSFHYADKTLFDSVAQEEETKPAKNEYLECKNNSIINNKEMITIRVRSNFDEDFIEIDIDKQNTEFEFFVDLCRKELNHVSDNYKINKIRKLPNILIRNSNDIKRLKNEQEIEFVFVP